MKFLLRQRTIAAFLAVCFLLTCLLCFAVLYLKPGPYRLLDWLINYEAGFVRRGLTGQLAFEMYNALGVGPVHTVFALQVTAYALFFVYAYLLLARIRDRAPFVLLIYSPFLFFFQIASWHGGYRKEILFLAAVAIVAHEFACRESDLRRFATLCIALALYPVLILSHEIHACYLPYFLMFGALVRLDAGRIVILATLASLSVLATAIVTIFSGDVEHVAGICASLRGIVPSSEAIAGCLTENNAILWLAKRTEDGVRLVRSDIRVLLGSLTPALLLVGFGFLPLRNILHYLRRRELHALILASSTSVFMSLALFVVAVDWGRFIYIHAVAIAIIVMALTIRAQGEEEWGDPRGVHISTWVVTAYLLGWNLEHKNILIGGGFVVNYLLRFLFGPD